MSAVISITSFRKNDALVVCIDSLIKHGYFQGDTTLHIADDQPPGEEIPNAREVYEKYLPILSHKINYSGGKRRMGIWGNKNRSIRFFLENSKADNLIMCDDDIQFIKGGLVGLFIKASQNSKHQHLLGYLNDIEDSTSINPEKNRFYRQFPVEAEDEHLAWVKGSHGLCLFFTRELLMKVGYHEAWPHVYGLEHSNLSSRCNAMQGYHPEMMPTLKQSPKYYFTQSIGNRYDAQVDLAFKLNDPLYHKRLVETYRGINLSNFNHHLDIKQEITL